MCKFYLIMVTQCKGNKVGKVLPWSEKVKVKGERKKTICCVYQILQSEQIFSSSDNLKYIIIIFLFYYYYLISYTV